MITLRNTFHNTEIRIRKGFGERVSMPTLKRWRRALCGFDGCSCGQDVASQRGPELDAWVVEADSRGTCTVTRPGAFGWRQ